MKKNIILVVFDCLRADFCFPNAPLFVERFKNKGESYTQFISVATSTVPCFTSILTGLYPDSHGIPGHPITRKKITEENWSLKKGVVTLPQILKARGYNTYAEFSDPLIKPFGLYRGFDHYNVRDQKISIFDNNFFSQLKELVNNMKSPYFFMLHLFWLHHSNTLKRFEELCSKLEELFKDVDLDNTIFIVTGDHGEGINDGIKHGKHILEHLVRIPLIISERDINKKIISEQYSQIDLTPLILNKLDIKPDLPYEIQGDIHPRKYTYMRAVGAPLPEEQWLAGIRTENYKYIIKIKNKKTQTLYHLSDEKEPLLEEEYKDLVNILRSKLLDIMGQAEQLQLGDRDKWTKEDEARVMDRLKALGYIE